VAAALLVAGSLAACRASGDPVEPELAVGGQLGTYVVPAGIHKIKHVIIVMQENRSFDSYFGTFPGADGIPVLDEVPAVCVPNPAGGCTVPYHDSADVDGGGPHAEADAIADVDGGRMDGFIRQRRAARTSCHLVADPACAAAATPDVMGYHTAAEIPDYWAYARDFALDDRMFEPVKSWSLPERLYLVSGWSAQCRTPAPMSCAGDIAGPYGLTAFDTAVSQELASGTASIDLAWTDITWLLYRHHVSWAYYVQAGSQPDCADAAAETCAAVRQNLQTLGIWNPLPLFADVQHDRQVGNVQSLGAWGAPSRRPGGDTGLRRAAGDCVGAAVLARRLGNVHLCGESEEVPVIFRLLGNGGTTPACGRKRTLSCSERGNGQAWGQVSAASRCASRHSHRAWPGRTAGRSASPACWLRRRPSPPSTPATCRRTGAESRRSRSARRSRSLGARRRSSRCPSR
jgi:hypothetical protein